MQNMQHLNRRIKIYGSELSYVLKTEVSIVLQNIFEH